MIMADVLKIFLLVVGAQLVLIAWWLAAESLAPGFVGRARDRFSSHPIRTVLLGVLLGAPLAAGGLTLLQAGGGGKLAGFLLLAATFTGGMFGSAGLCRRIGAGLPSPADGAQPWRRVLRGGAVLSAVFLLPFLGWFAVLPLVVLSGLGAAIGAAWGREPAPAVAAR